MLKGGTIPVKEISGIPMIRKKSNSLYCQVFIGLTFLVCVTMGFKPPGTDEQLRAIGPTGGLPESLGLALGPGNDFEPIPLPRRGDWLAEHHEPGQTFDDYAR